jgi:hypothetical protein
MRISCACVVGLLSSVLPAQTTHVVGPGGFAQVDLALAVAAPGDVILVQPGTYGPFTATLDVTIRAAAPGTVTVGGTFPLASSSQVLLDAGERVHLVDLKLTGIFSSGGTTVLDRCEVTLFFFGGGARVTNGTLVLQGCQLTGSNGTEAAGLHATNATVTAIDCNIRGIDVGSFEGPPPGYGIYLDNSDLYGSRLTVVGGSGYGSLYPSAEAMKAIGSSHVWVSDSTFSNGGLCPVDAALGRLARCVLPPGCPPGISNTGPMLGLHFPPMTSPSAVWLEFRTAAANEAVGVYLSSGLGFATLPLLEQPILLDVANALPFALVVADATGHATAACAIPAGFTGLEFWFQGISGASVPLQLSPVGGGIVRAPSGPLSITLVDPVSAAVGAAITVTGANFLPGLTVAVNSMPIVPTSVTSTQVVFPYPAGIACDSQVSLTNPNGQVAAAPLNPTPVVSGTLPGSGTAAGNQLCVVQGSGFVAGTTVTIGGAVASVLTSGTVALIVRTPPGTPGTASVVITTPGGCTASTTYTYL